MLRSLTMMDSRGEKINVPFMATARTPRRYKQIFGRDLMKDFELITGGEADEQAMLEVAERLAFVMHAQAAGKDFKEISRDAEGAVADWLDTLDSFAITGNLLEIVSVYSDAKRMGSETKNALAQLSAK